MRLLKWCLAHVRLLMINSICLVCYLILTLYASSVTGHLDSQQEASRWSDGTIKYHQVSAFMQEGSGIAADRITEVRSTLQTKITDASFSSDSVNGRLWVDAYCAMASESVSKESDLGMAAVDGVNVIGVSDDFFLFHPLSMIAGSCFRAESVSKDAVVIDEATAWALYGASDIAGKNVQIGGQNFVISGVYRPSDDKYETLARGGESYIFMSYDAFSVLHPEASITAYEAVVPNPVKGFALTALKEAFGEDENASVSDPVKDLNFSAIEYVDNTARFEAVTLYKKLWYLPRTLMRVNHVAYPYWENAVRAQEIRVAFLLLFRTIALLIPVLTVIFSVVFFVKKEYSSFKAFLKKKFSDAIEYLNEKSRIRMERKAEEKAVEEKAEEEKAEEKTEEEKAAEDKAEEKKEEEKAAEEKAEESE